MERIQKAKRRHPEEDGNDATVRGLAYHYIDGKRGTSSTTALDEAFSGVSEAARYAKEVPFGRDREAFERGGLVFKPSFVHVTRLSSKTSDSHLVQERTSTRDAEGVLHVEGSRTNGSFVRFSFISCTRASKTSPFRRFSTIHDPLSFRISTWLVTRTPRGAFACESSTIRSTYTKTKDLSRSSRLHRSRRATFEIRRNRIRVFVAS